MKHVAIVEKSCLNCGNRSGATTEINFIFSFKIFRFSWPTNYLTFVRQTFNTTFSDIVESSLAAVVWAGEASTIDLKLASVNPAAESVVMNFGTNVIAGSLTRFYYCGGVIIFCWSLAVSLSMDIKYTATTSLNPKVIVQRFGLIARPLVIRSAKFLR